MLKSNIINEVETRENINEVLSFLSNTLSKTLGPYGSTTIVQDRQGEHFMTKDGYTVLKSIQIKENIGNTVLNIIKKISKNLVRTVGDGSTSSIIVSAELYKELNSFIAQYSISSKDLLDGLAIISNELISSIKTKAFPISEDLSELKDIAKVSLNNDKELGLLIHEMYTKIGKYGFISIEHGKDIDEYKITNGITVKRGFIDFRFANDNKKMICEFEKPLVMMVNDRLAERDLPMLAEIVGKIVSLQKPLIIIAKGYDMDVKNFLAINKVKSGDQLPICAIDYAINDAYALDCFDDLAISLGCTYWNKAENEQIDTYELERCGTCKKIIVNDHESQFIEGGGHPSTIKSRYNAINQEYQNDLAMLNVNEEYLTKTRKRLATLSNSMAVFYVGGESDVERSTKYFLVEDAIYACQSAIENGYIIGGNLITPQIIADPNEFHKITKLVFEFFKSRRIIESSSDVAILNGLTSNLVNIIEKSFLKSFSLVLKNASLKDDDIDSIISNCMKNNSIYNLKTKEFETASDTSIINSCETDIEIIKSAFSIIGLLVTSNQFASFDILNY